MYGLLPLGEAKIGYIPPTSDEIRALLKLYSITSAEAGRLIGVSEDDMRNHIWSVCPIPYLAWLKLTKMLEGR